MEFCKDFMWGTASAAYQIEGAYKEDGKGLNIWDAYCQGLGRVAHGENGNVACDHYHRFREDVQILKNMGVKFYRFSLSWSRIIPEGTGKVNEAGVKFYNDLIDELIANGITPMITLFHWDYPYALHKRGGWLSRESSDWFEEYAKVAVESFSDRVKYWMTINEPQIFIGCGYTIGKHAPFLSLQNKDLTTISHNVLLSHGKAVKVIRENAKLEPIVGFAYATPSAEPVDETPEAIEEARVKSFDVTEEKFTFGTSWWADPIFFGKYPDKAYEIFGDDMPEIQPGDMEIISQPVDFYGLNLYETMGDRDSLGYAENAYIGIARTSCEWPVTPNVLYWTPKFIYERYNVPIIITENGMAGHDWIHLDGKVHDPHRIDFVKRYLRALHRAHTEGVPIKGYMYWSVLDNFEWSDGYDKRFGLVYVDYRTCERTVKDSGVWYKSVIESNGAEIFKD